SFNFGAPAMIPPESFFVLEKILARKPRRLRWVFIEWAEVKTAIEKRKETTIEVLYWHDAAETALTAEIIAARFDRPGSPSRWGRIVSAFAQKTWPHLRLFLTNNANLGRGLDLFAHAGAGSRDRAEKNYELTGGFSGLRE